MWGRGDWDMASFCFLHSLLQTAVVLNSSRCPDRSAWEELQNAPPAALSDWLTFDLGTNPWQCNTALGEVDVSKLLPETPGDFTLEKAADIATWQSDVVNHLSVAQANIALISDNLWGTRCGSGHRAGARGEQAVMTLLEPARADATLWERIWLNVLPADDWADRQQRECLEDFHFPWTRPIPERALTPENTHSLGILWQMPRRWRICVDNDGLVRTMHRQNKGRDYDGWEKLHPLTPYFVKADGTWTAAKVAAHTGFRDWASLALQGREKTRPATVVLAILESGVISGPLRIRCCGWALGDSGAAGGWVDHVVPFYYKPLDQTDAIEAAVQDADKQQYRLNKALKEAGVPGARANEMLLTRAESEFYRRVSTDDFCDERGSWKNYLRTLAQQLFWELIESHRVDMMKASQAFSRL
jgi:CRISPR system Cascade subunit CasA